MRIPWLVSLVVAFLLFGAVQAQEENPVLLEIESYVVSQVTREDGTREDRFTRATQARPGQTVEYRVIARNVSQETLPPGIVVITIEVAEGTQFVSSSATPSTEVLLTEFSADGQTTFAETNVFIGLGDDRRIAEPSAYTHIRWTLLEEMEPGTERTLVFRAIRL